MSLQTDIREIVDQVCTMMLGASIERCSTLEPTDGDDRIAGCIQISGQWQGVVLLQATHGFSSLAASQMLATPPHELTWSDRQDTMAELTNMIGGNIKSLVPGPSYLSLPSVTMGKDFDIRLYGTVLDTVVPVCCRGERVSVMLFRAEEAEALQPRWTASDTHSQA